MENIINIVFNVASFGLVLGILAVGVLLFMNGYFKIPTDKAGVVSGLSKEPRIVIGKAGFKVPFLERLDYLYLGLLNVDVKTQDYVPTREFINVKLDAFATVKIKNDAESLKKACVHFLNNTSSDIVATVQQVLEGSLRDITGSMNLKEMVNNRQAVSDRVQETATADLEQMGLEIVSLNIQNIYDENDVIDSLGIDNVEKIRKDAQIAKAEAERDVQIARAKALQESNEARMSSEKNIAEKQNEVAIRKAELKKLSDAEQAKADVAYSIQEQEQRKELEIKKVNADIAQREREVVLMEQQSKVKEQILDAEIRRRADAEKYEREKQAEADLFVTKQQAEANLVVRQKEAEANLYSAEKEAEAIRMKGLAEAEAIRARGVAEAEALEKKAEAMEKFGKAAMAEMAIKVLPEVAKEIAKPLSSISDVKIYAQNGEAVGGLSGSVPVVMSHVFDTVKEATGVDLKAIADSNTIDAKVNRNYVVNGELPPVKVVPLSCSPEQVSE